MASQLTAAATAQCKQSSTLETLERRVDDYVSIAAWQILHC